MITVPRFAVYCVAAMRVIECVYFTGVPAHPHHKGYLPGDWLGSPPCFPMLFLAFPKVLFTSRCNDTCAAVCRHLPRGDAVNRMCVFYGCSCTPPSQGLLTWWLAWLSACFSCAFPMLFRRFYLLPGAMIPVPRFAVYCVAAMRSPSESKWVQVNPSETK